ncbi:JHS1, partial [Symbiodinium microadriaticum]
TPHLRLRNLVIDMQPPQFDSGEVPDGICMFAPEAMDGNKYLAALKILRKQQQGAMRCNDVTYIHGIAFYRGCLPFDLLREYCDLNADQQAAVAKVLSAKDYVLLLGMPGTGKTSTIAFVVRMMMAKGARVLITSYTHSAVDNLLEKLVARGTSPRILGRIGSKTSVRIPLHPYLLNEPSGMEHDQSKVLTSTTKRISGLRVVGCTVLTAARHALLQTMKFDWCVTDGSGQISQPASLGPLMLSSRFLLVGDDYQLPPIVQSREAAAKGMDVSLFKRLGEAHPEAVTTLTSQYRMNDQVMALCNTLIYEHRLSCGNDDVARARLCFLKSEALGSFVNSELSHLHSWLNSALDPSRCVVFLNTDSIDFQLSHVHLSSSDDMNDSSNLDSAPIGPPLQRSNSPRGRGQSTSDAEVVVVRALVKQLKACGVDLSGVGIISPYRAQVRVLQQALQQTCNSIEEWNATAEEGPVVSTVDKFQGRDMDMIVISMVRNMQDNSAGELLRDWRRVNVAISRARYKLVFIGSLLLMRTVPILSQLAHFCEARDAVTDLPASIKTCIDI